MLTLASKSPYAHAGPKHGSSMAFRALPANFSSPGHGKATPRLQVESAETCVAHFHNLSGSDIDSLRSGSIPFSYRIHDPAATFRGSEIWFASGGEVNSLAVIGEVVSVGGRLSNSGLGRRGGGWPTVSCLTKQFREEERRRLIRWKRGPNDFVQECCAVSFDRR